MVLQIIDVIRRKGTAPGRPAGPRAVTSWGNKGHHVGKWLDALKDAKTQGEYAHDVLSAPMPKLPKAKGERVPSSGEHLDRDENWLRDKVKKWLDFQGFIYWVVPITQALAGSESAGTLRKASHPLAGWSDITGLLPGGRRFDIELKAPRGGTLSAKQRNHLDKVNAGGGFAIVANSLESIVLAFQAEGVVLRAPGDDRKGATSRTQMGKRQSGS